MKPWRRSDRTAEEVAFDALGKLQLPPGGKGATAKEQAALSHRLNWSDSADEALESQSVLRARVLLYVVLVVVAVLLYWASWAQLDEVTRGEARVVPSSQRQLVQSFDGGVVSEIAVSEGDIVDAGQLLMRIDPTRFEASVRESQAEYLSLLARSARLQALAANEPLELPEEVTQQAPELAMREERLYQSSRNEVNERRRSALDRLNQRQQELREIEARRNQITRSLAITRQELEMTRPLLQAGAVAEVEVLRLEREVSDAEGELEQIEAQLSRTQSAISEAERNLNEIELAAAVDWRQELSQTEARLSALVENMAGLQDRVAYTELRAPVRGIVQRLFITTRGGVVQPGREVLELVPLDDRLIVEARIAPQDIAFLRPGLPAVVKITAYDFAQYGGLDGTVEHISADTITDDEGNTFYRVRIGTQRGELSEQFDIIPGMTAQVDVLTGKRTVLEYLLKPVLRAREIALRER